MRSVKIIVVYYNLQNLDIEWRCNKVFNLNNITIQTITETLTKLPIKNFSLISYRMPYVPKELFSSPSLEKLNLNDDDINSETTRYIAQWLTNNTVLRELYLKGNPINNEGAQYFGEWLSDFSLQIVSLSNCGIGPKGAQAIAQGLGNNTALRKLYLNSNPINSTGAQYFGEWLSKFFLQLLSLNDCDIGPKGAQAIAQGLGNNTALQELDLEKNRIQLQGALSIWEKLIFGSLLEKLDLYYNGIHISSTAVNPLLSVISHSMIQSLNLWSNTIDLNRTEIDKLCQSALAVRDRKIEISTRAGYISNHKRPYYFGDDLCFTSAASRLEPPFPLNLLAAFYKAAKEYLYSTPRWTLVDFVDTNERSAPRPITHKSRNNMPTITPETTTDNADMNAVGSTWSWSLFNNFSENIMLGVVIVHLGKKVYSWLFSNQETEIRTEAPVADDYFAAKVAQCTYQLQNIKKQFKKLHLKKSHWAFWSLEEHERTLSDLVRKDWGNGSELKEVCRDIEHFKNEIRRERVLQRAAARNAGNHARSHHSMTKHTSRVSCTPLPNPYTWFAKVKSKTDDSRNSTNGTRYTAIPC